ncbi:MAG: hypothetical protein EOO51_06610 [Flavobacterium sp.]|nr:MAG: hypothetical protein EOO51_06610 [Flavobacterium sp.]
MYNFVLKLHSGWAYIVLIMMLIAVVNALIGLSSKNPFTLKDRRISLFALTAVHIQLLIGLVLYFTSPNGMAKFGMIKMADMQPIDRLLALEHPLVNLIAIALITIGWSKHKRVPVVEGSEQYKQFKSIAIFYGIGLLLLLSRIPWQTWFS